MFEQIISLPYAPMLLGFAALLAVAVVADLVAKAILVRLVNGFTRRTAFEWDDALAQANVFGRLAQVIPALMVLGGVHLIPNLADESIRLIRNVSMGYIVLMLTLALVAMLSAANTIYEGFPVSRHRPIKGFVQVAQIVVVIFGGVLVIAAVSDRSPLLLLSGFGAMTAILLLVFKDTILSLVASVQLMSQDMIRVGDWIEMSQFGADGDVIDVALHTVKVQNWDKTITTIPTHQLISGSFRNWRGMSDSGGRRIKRSILIDLSTIRFLTQSEIDNFARFSLLADYIRDMQKKLKDYNNNLPTAVDDEVNLRRLTNIGTFRTYVYNYLKNHKSLRENMTLLVRQLQPSAQGLPIEIYVFTATTAWAEYESIQADIFDHLFSILDEFGLRAFQEPTGEDLSAGLQRASH